MVDPVFFFLVRVFVSAEGAFCTSEDSLPEGVVDESGSAGEVADGFGMAAVFFRDTSWVSSAAVLLSFSEPRSLATINVL